MANSEPSSKGKPSPPPLLCQPIAGWNRAILTVHMLDICCLASCADTGIPFAFAGTQHKESRPRCPGLEFLPTHSMGSPARTTSAPRRPNKRVLHRSRQGQDRGHHRGGGRYHRMARGRPPGRTRIVGCQSVFATTGSQTPTGEKTQRLVLSLPPTR